MFGNQNETSNENPAPSRRVVGIKLTDVSSDKWEALAKLVSADIQLGFATTRACVKNGVNYLSYYAWLNKDMKRASTRRWQNKQKQSTEYVAVLRKETPNPAVTTARRITIPTPAPIQTNGKMKMVVFTGTPTELAEIAKALNE